jgi:hypothetical protein
VLRRSKHSKIEVIAPKEEEEDGVSNDKMGGTSSMHR